jgi:hypothetical protein
MGAHRRSLVATVAVACLIASAALVGTATAQPGGAGRASLELYQATVDTEQYQQLLAGGYDVASVEETAEGFIVQVVLRPNERNKLGREGFDFEVVRNSDGQTSAEAALQQQQEGFTVWRDWDSPGGHEEQIRNLVRQYPQITQLHTIGTTH